MDIVKFEAVEKRILDVRGQKVILDSDVAELYGVETKRVNEAVKNNLDKFPEGYIIALNKKEWDGLKSKFSTSIKGGKVKLPSAFTRLRRKPPTPVGGAPLKKVCICLPLLALLNAQHLEEDLTRVLESP